MPYNGPMVVRKTSRREARLDEEHDRLLEEQLRRRDLTFSAWLREQIDQGAAAESEALARRQEAVERLTSMNIDFGWDPADPDPATRLLDEAYEARWRDADPLG